MQLSVRRVPFEGVSEADRDAWRDLATRSLEPNMCLEPDYLMPLLGRVGDDALRVLFVERGSTMLLAALVQAESRKAGPLRIPVTSTSGDFMERETGHSAPLVDRDDAEAALSAWFGAARHERGAGAVWIPELYDDGAIASAVRTVVEREGIPSVTFARAHMPFYRAGDWPAVDSSDEQSVVTSHLARGRRQETNRSLRRIEAEFGTAARIEDLTHVPGAVDQFVSMQSAGWKGDVERGGHAFGLSAARTQALHEIVEAFRDRGALHIGALYGAETCLHMSLSLRAATGTWFTPFDAFDEQFSHLGVGRVGRLALLQTLVSRFPDSDIDPCYKGTSPAVASTFPRQRWAVGMLIGAGGPGVRAAVRVIGARERRK
jgi:hypothetical protein